MEVLISENKIEKRINELAKEINKEYENKYEFVNTTGAQTEGIYKLEKQVVNYYYQKKATKVKVLHVLEGTDVSSPENVTDVLYNILLAVGIIAAVIVGLIIGIKYMMGSVAQKAETKELLAPYIVGCVIIFGAFAIWKIVVNLLNQTQV